MRESKIEKYLRAQVTTRGGYCFKWVSPQHVGVPDRIVFLNQQIWFIELKTEIGKLSAMQRIIGKVILQYTDNYRVVNSKEEIDKLILEIMQKV